MDRESLKKCICKFFVDAPSIEGLENNKIIFITSIGMIIANGIDDSSAEHSVITKLTESIAEVYCESHNIGDEPLPENDGYILLKDVVIKNSNTTYNFNEIVLFYDQIIGITIGNIE